MTGTVTIVPHRTNPNVEPIRLTSNQYYGGLNRRFERRAALARIGWKYRHVEIKRYEGEIRPMTTAGFVHKWRKGYIPASSVLEYRNEGFIRMLESVLR